MERKDEKERYNVKLIAGFVVRSDIGEKYKLLLDCLYEEYSLYEELARLCEREHKLIDLGDMVRLREFLIQKHNLLEKIIAIEKRKCEIEEMESTKSGFNGDEKKVIDAFIKEFKSLIDKVSDMQKKNQEFMASKHKAEVEEFIRLKKGISMNKAYSVYGDTVADTRYINRVR